jgi:hypothetical protein
MRRLLMSAAFAAAMFAGSAAAEPVSIAPVNVSDDLREEFRDDFGDRELTYLQEMVASRVSDALVRRGAHLDSQAPLVVEVTLIEADPSKPTMKQMGDTLGLDYFSSVSVGGAELSAVLRRADGAVVDEVSYRRYAHSLEDVALAAGPWSDARRAVMQFADRVADAYTRQSDSASAQ